MGGTSGCHAIKLFSMKKESILFALFFITCAVLAQPNTYYYHAPDVPNENISGLFLESPLTLQYQDMVGEKGIKSVIAYKSLWDTLANTWGDTIMVFKQEVTETTASILATETQWHKNGTQLAPLRKIDIFNPPNWTWGSVLSPDSIKAYHWEVTTNAWKLDKKVVYQRYKWYITERLVYMADNPQPDTIWTYSFPGVGEITCHKKEKLNTGGYLVQDSLLYLYQFDTLCDYYFHSSWDTAIGSFRIVEYFELYYIQKIIFTSRYVYAIGGGNPSFTTKVYKGKFEDTKTLTFEVDTLVVGYPNLYGLYSNILQFDDDWLPKERREEFAYSLLGPQDSFIRHSYVLHDSLKLVTTSTREKRIYLFEPFSPQMRWLFSFANVSLSPSYEPIDVSNKQPLLQIIGTTAAGGQIAQLMDFGNLNSSKRITILGRDGTVCYQDEFMGETHRFDLDDWPPGIYIAQVTSSDGRVIAKQFWHLR
jgi:hypothetical protein